ncbi:MAG TPA: hypothetical protein VF544_11390 [Pyrinomonadaceae bacterium]
MARNINHDDLISLYLLGELSEQEQHQIEKGYFEDDDYFAQLLSAEDELIERYLRHELSEGERSRFEKAFLGNPRRRRRVETYQALISPARQIRQPLKDRPSYLIWLDALRTFLSGNGKIIPVALALLLLAVLAGLWLYTKNSAPQREVAANRAEQHEVKPESSPQIVQNPPATPPGANRPSEENPQGTAPGRKAQRDQRQPRLENGSGPGPQQTPIVATFMLIPGTLQRGAELRTIEVRPDVTLIRLELGLLENDFSTYTVVLSQAGGRQIRKWPELKAQSRAGGAVVVVNLPARQITSGVFEFSLYGVNSGHDAQEVEDYQFRVIKIPS